MDSSMDGLDVSAEGKRGARPPAAPARARCLQTESRRGFGAACRRRSVRAGREAGGRCVPRSGGVRSRPRNLRGAPDVSGQGFAACGAWGWTRRTRGVVRSQVALARLHRFSTRRFEPLVVSWCAFVPSPEFRFPFLPPLRLPGLWAGTKGGGEMPVALGLPLLGSRPGAELSVASRGESLLFILHYISRGHPLCFSVTPSP